MSDTVFAVFSGTEGYNDYYDDGHECAKFKLLRVFSIKSDAENFVESCKVQQDEINSLKSDFDRKLRNFRCGSFKFSEDAVNPPEPKVPSKKKPVFDGDKKLFAKQMENWKESKKQYSIDIADYNNKYRGEERMLILQHRQEKQKKQQIAEYRIKLASELVGGKYTADQIEKMQTSYNSVYRIEEVEFDAGRTK